MLRILTFALFVVGLVGPTLPAIAQDNPDATALRHVITDQMRAFQADDASAAYAFASPRLKELYQNPDTFIEMVRQGYGPVYRAKAVSFGRLQVTDFGPTQEVFVTGPDGSDWVALYTFERQPDGSWKISGCYLTRGGGGAA